MRTLPTLFSLLIAAAAVAQQDPVVTLRDAASNVVNNTTLIVYGNPSSNLLEQDLTAELNATATSVINVRRYELNTVPGSRNYFCWGVCYLPDTSGETPVWVSDSSVTMNPQQVVNNFHAYYKPMGAAAYACFQFVWYDMADPTDSTWVNICFDTQTFTGTEEVATGSALEAFPNPVAGGEVTFAFGAGADTGGLQLVLYNALGERALVRSLSTATGRAVVPVNSLANGVWFAALEQNGHMVATKRLVVGR